MSATVDGVEAILEEFDEYLALERGRSDHTRRAYMGDLRSLFDFLAERVRRGQVEQLVERFRGHDGHLVVMGDFNCPWSERRRSLDILLHELKLRPCRESAATYPAWRPLVRLDWILVSDGLDFSSYSTLSDRVSDHLGVVAEIRRRTTAVHPGERQRRQARRLPNVSLA